MAPAWLRTPELGKKRSTMACSTSEVSRLSEPALCARPAARCTPSAAATCSRPPRMPPPPPQNLARCFTSSTAGPNILLTFAMNPSRVLGSGRPPVSTFDGGRAKFLGAPRTPPTSRRPAGELGAAERAGEVAVVDAVAAEGVKVDAVRGEHGDRAPRVRVAAGVEAGEVELPRDGAPAGGARQGEAELEQVELVDVALHDGVALPRRAEVARRGDVVHRAGELRVHGHDGVDAAGDRGEKLGASELSLDRAVTISGGADMCMKPNPDWTAAIGKNGSGGGGASMTGPTSPGNIGMAGRGGGGDEAAPAIATRRRVSFASSSSSGGECGICMLFIKVKMWMYFPFLIGG
ncbi:hypothetical protein OsJ_06589 [Oryza sativa Japonica Group]|uniref:Uncharacterized protein n=1 Tax=Oryza sativa subsp. japonica TaxID=39947 RepID=B9EZS2_ORYSJ|nr:hypothetical protein OsJ_06589 [Oryza sativa Japonica Group]